MTAHASTELEFRLLGPLEAGSVDAPVVLGGTKRRALLADLLVHLGQVVSVDRLIDDLWGEDPPPTARHALEVHVSTLRKALALGGSDAAVVTQPPGYRLEASPDRVDAFRFERLVAEGRAALAAGEPERAALVLRDALELWRSPPLPEFVYEPFAQAEIARLEDLRIRALELRIDADLALGLGADLVSELEALTAEHPFRERLCAQLMTALYKAGRQADALTALRRTRRVLREELGLDPGPDLRELEKAILSHDVSLAPRAVSPALRVDRRALVTVLFVDIVDSTALMGTLDQETSRAILRRYFELVSAAVLRHGGTIEKFVGDAVMAAFGTPIAHEDDALRAARSASEIRSVLAGYARELARDQGVSFAVRLGLETGEVVTGAPAAGEGFVTGPCVGLAERLERAAGPGGIVVGEQARHLFDTAAVL